MGTSTIKKMLVSDIKPRPFRWVLTAHILKAEVGATRFLSESIRISTALQDIVYRKTDTAA
jgi:hypothetical protein